MKTETHSLYTIPEGITVNDFFHSSSAPWDGWATTWAGSTRTSSRLWRPRGRSKPKTSTTETSPRPRLLPTQRRQLLHRPNQSQNRLQHLVSLKISSSFFLEKYITLCEKRWACETNFLLGANLKASTLYRSRHKIPAWTLFVRPACPVDTFWSVPFQRVCPFGVYLSIWPGQGYVVR